MDLKPNADKKYYNNTQNNAQKFIFFLNSHRLKQIAQKSDEKK